MQIKPTVSYDDFTKLHIAVGRIVEVKDFDRARRPTYKVRIDFGADIGEKWSSVQAKADYPEELMNGRLVVALINLPPKNIAGFMSEALVLGVPAEDESLSLLEPSRGARLGANVY